jgi:hypothetical protein
MANEKRKRQMFIGGLVENNPLASGGTQLDSAALSSITGGVASTEHMAIVLDPDGIDGAPEVAYITDLTASATSTGATGLLRGQEGTTARAHLRDIPWVHAPTLRECVTSDFYTYDTGSASNFTMNSTSWVDLTTNDLVVPGWPGDILELGFNAFVDSQVVSARLGFQTRVSGAGVAEIGDGNYGSWHLEDNGQREQVAGVAQYLVVSGDVSSGTITLRPRYKTGSATNRTLFANNNANGQRLHYWVKNLGPEAA